MRKTFVGFKPSGRLGLSGDGQEELGRNEREPETALPHAHSWGCLPWGLQTGARARGRGHPWEKALGLAACGQQTAPCRTLSQTAPASQLDFVQIIFPSNLKFWVFFLTVAPLKALGTPSLASVGRVRVTSRPHPRASGLGPPRPVSTLWHGE